MGFQNIGANYWKGEEGRKALIEGKPKFTDPPYVETCSRSSRAGRLIWATAIKAQKYPDTQNLFTLGRAAIYPAGSWDVPIFSKQADFEFDAFAPPVAKAGDNATSATTRISRSASTPSRRTPKPPRSSCPGWLRPSSLRFTPTSCRVLPVLERESRLEGSDRSCGSSFRRCRASRRTWPRPDPSRRPSHSRAGRSPAARWRRSRRIRRSHPGQEGLGGLRRSSTWH